MQRLENAYGNKFYCSIWHQVLIVCVGPQLSPLGYWLPFSDGSVPYVFSKVYSFISQ